MLCNVSVSSQSNEIMIDQVKYISNPTDKIDFIYSSLKRLQKYVLQLLIRKKRFILYTTILLGISLIIFGEAIYKQLKQKARPAGFDRSVSKILENPPDKNLCIVC